MLQNKFLLLMITATFINIPARAEGTPAGISTGETQAWKTGKGLDQYASERYNRFIKTPLSVVTAEPAAPRSYPSELESWLKKGRQLNSLGKGGGNIRSAMVAMILSLAAIKLENENRTSSSEAIVENNEKNLNDPMQAYEAVLNSGMKWVREKFSTKSTQAN